MESTLPGLEKELADLDTEQQNTLAQAQLRDKELEVVATDTVEQARLKQEERAGLRLFSAIISLVPIGQPYTGIAGQTIAGDLSGNSFWSSLSGAVSSFSQLESYEKQINDFQSAFSKLDFLSLSAFMDSYKANQQQLDDSLGSIRTYVEDELHTVSQNTVSDRDVAAVLAGLEQSDAAFQSLMTHLNDLKEQKNTVGLCDRSRGAGRGSLQEIPRGRSQLHGQVF